MILIYLFILAGIVIATLLLAKRIEEKRRKNVFFLRVISRGDVKIRELHNNVVRLYSTSKEKTSFFVGRQLPRYSRSSLNKAVAKFEENMQVYLERLRDSKIIKKKDAGISEFFKNMSEVEKGTGEINDNIYIGETEPIREEVVDAVDETPIQTVEIELEINEPIASPYVPEPMAESTEPVIEKPKVKKPRAPRKAPTKRKLKVVEVVGEEQI